MRLQNPRAVLRRSFPRNKLILFSAPALVAPFAGVFFIAWLAEESGLWAVRLLALPLIAALQNHLQILLHEGAHHNLHGNRRVNDLLADLLCALPFFGFIRHYRFFHLQHHRFLLDPLLDPEVEFYASQGHRYEKKNLPALLKMLFLDFCGYHYFEFFISYNVYLFRERMMKLTAQECASAALVMGILGVGFYLGWSFEILFYWFLPQPTFLFLFLKLQGYGEHGARTKSVEGSTFAHSFGPLTRFFIYPLNSDLHLQHHLEPSIPWFRLPRDREHRDSYFSVIKNLLRPG